jgi:hypothetical protein
MSIAGARTGRDGAIDFAGKTDALRIRDDHIVKIETAEK